MSYNDITPGVAWAQGIQKVIDQQDGYRAEANAQQAGYNQGYNQGKKKGYKKGVSDAWLHANEEIATLNQTVTNFKQALVKMEKERDLAQAEVEQLVFVAKTGGNFITELKGADFYKDWRNKVAAESVSIYQSSLKDKGYKF